MSFFTTLRWLRQPRISIFAIILIAITIITTVAVSLFMTNPKDIPSALASGVTRTISDAGGNWSDTAAWAGGVVPEAGDDVVATGTSGNLVINADTAALNSFDLTNYVGTMSGANAIIVAGSAGNTTAVLFAGTQTWTGTLNLNPPATATINLTMGSLTTSGTCGGITVAGTTTGAVVLQDAMTMGATKILTLTSGTLNTNNQTLNIGLFNGSGTTTRTVTLGSSNITLTNTVNYTASWSFSNATGLTFNCDTSTITITGLNVFMYGGSKIYNNVVFTGGGGNQLTGTNTFTNLTYTGIASTAGILSIYGPNTITGTLTINGAAANQRVLITSDTIGTARTITAAAVVLSNVDFRDITFAGTMTVTSATSIGDCGGNSGVNWASIVTAPTTQTWNGTTGNWSDSTKWTSRVPLPQDTVVLAGTNVVTADMPRLGKDISFTGATPLTLGNTVTSYGSVNFTNAGTFNYGGGGYAWQFESQARTGTLTLTNNGVHFGISNVYVVGATLQLQDAYYGNSLIGLWNGTFDANNQTVYALGLASTGATTRSLIMGTGTWSLTRASATLAVWDATGITSLNSTGSTIALTDTTSTAKLFNGGGLTYNNLTLPTNNAGNVTISGNNTFNNLILNGGGAGIDYITGSNTISGTLTVGALKTVTFTSGTTQTINGTFSANGTSASLITLNSSTPASPATISHAGNFDTNWNSIQDITSSGGGSWHAHFSTSVSGNSGITFDAYKTISVAGGNWGDVGAWTGGVIPIAGDDVGALTTSGSLVVNADTANLNSFDLTGYAATLSGANAITVVGTAGLTTNVKFAGTMTWTGTLSLNPPATATINLTMGTLTTSGTCGGITVAGTTTGAVVLQDTLTIGSTKYLTLTSGTLNTNNQTITAGRLLLTDNGITKTLTLGSSSITITGGGADVLFGGSSGGPGVTLNPGTSTITLTGAAARVYGPNTKPWNNIVFSGSGAAQMNWAQAANVTRTGTAATTDSFVMANSFTVSGTLTINGAAANQRLLGTSDTLGTARTVTAGAVVLSNVDFRDITFAGTMTVTSATSIGDCGGNSGVNWASIVTAPTTQTWDGATGNWSTAARWTSRVPLPQDTVVLAGTNVVTADMPRLGKDISFSAAAKLTLGIAVTSYGSVSFTSAGTFSGSYEWNFESQARTGTLYLTNAGKTFPSTINIRVVGTTLQLLDAIPNASRSFLYNGTFDTASFNITTFSFASSSGTTLNLGNTTWLLYGDSSWTVNASATVNAGTSTISPVGFYSARPFTFWGGGKVYNNLTLPGAFADTLSITGANTFNNITFNAPKTVTFPSTVTQTINGTFTANGTSANLITLNSSTPASAATISHAGNFDTNWNSIQDITSSGGGSWVAHYSTSVSGNSGITFPAYKTISVAGGNWDAVGAWTGGVVPIADDEVTALTTSGSLVVNAATAALRSFDLTGYAATLSGASNITVAGSAGLTTAVKFAGTQTWTGTLNLNPPATATINLTMGSLTTSGTCGGITVAGTTTGAVVLQDALTIGATKTLTLTSGTLDTNNQTVNVGYLSSSNSNTRTMLLGSSTVTLTGTSATGIVLDFSTVSGFTFTAGTSQITFTGAQTGQNNTFSGSSKTFYNVTFQGSGATYVAAATFNNLTLTGSGVKTDTFWLGGNETISGILTINGNSATNRVLVTSNTLGTPRTITAANVSLSNVDFRDITGAGAAIPFTGTSLGDAGGNSGITFTEAVDQHWISATGGNWSDAAKWTSRVPLPQDNVYFNNAFSGGQTVSSDMPRLGKSIDWTGATGSPTWTKPISFTIYGSLTQISGMTLSGAATIITLQGRGNFTITSAGKVFSQQVYVQNIGGTYTLLDATNFGSSLYLAAGTFTANNVDVTTTTFNSANTSTRTLNMGSGTWTITYAATWTWETNTTGLTINAGTSTIVLASTTSTAQTFIGSGFTYNNLSITGGGSGAVIFTGANTFNNFTIGAPKTVTFTSGTTQTINGTFTANGTSASLITLNSSTPASAATISHAGNFDTNWNSIQDITSSGGGTWVAHYSTSVSGNSGITFVSFKRVSNSGGTRNYNDTASWDGGVVPGSSDDIYADVSSGNLTINVASSSKSADFTGYVGTLTHNVNTTWYIHGSLKFAAGMTYARPANDGVDGIRFTATTTGNTVTTAGKNLPNTTFNGAGGEWSLQDNLSVNAGVTWGSVLSVAQGTFNANGYNVTSAYLFSTGTATRVINMGTGTWSLSLNAGVAAWNVASAGLTLNPGTSTILLTNVAQDRTTFGGAGFTYYNLTITGGNATTLNGANTFNNLTIGAGLPATFSSNQTVNGTFATSGSFTLVGSGTYANWTHTGTAVKTNAITLSGNQTVTSTFTIAGQSAINRVLTTSNTLGTARTITAAAVVLSNVDFRDITFAGAMTVTSATSIGDCGGNSGVGWNVGGNFPTTAATQTWDGATGSWSTAARWTSRVPLPQDTVVLAGTNVVTADMPRLGKDISFSAAAKLTLGNAVTSYGSVDFTNAGTFSSGAGQWNFESQARSGTLTLTNNGKSFANHVQINVKSATLQLNDSISVSGNIFYLTNGTFSANNYNVLVGRIICASGIIVNMGSGVWTITVGDTTWTGAGTINANSSTILLTDVSATSKIFAGGNYIYNNLTLPASSAGNVTISGNNTFNNLTLNGGGAGIDYITGSNTISNLTIGANKTVTLTAATQQTISGTVSAVGTAGNAITLNSTTTTPATLSKSSGIVVGNYINVNYVNATGGAKWYGDLNSTITNSSGWSTDATPPTNPTTTTANVDATPIVADSWIKQAGTINYSFSGSTDPDSGLAGYYTYFGTNVAGDPVTYQANVTDPQTYSTPITTADDGKTLYFRIKTKDMVGNVGTALTLFTFGYDITLPTRPTFVAADPPGYTTTNSFDFSWPTGTDPAGPGGGASGIKWYEYKRAGIDVAWSHTADAATRTVSGIEAYQEGANAFYVRTVDNASNVSDYQQVTYYFSGVAPAKPTNLAITPNPSDTNDLTITWDKSATGPGDPPVVGYYYSINAAPTLANVTYVASQADQVSIGPDHFATLQGVNTVYVLGVNAAGNYSFEDAYVASETFNCQTAAPAAPVLVALTDSSNRAYDTWGLTASWSPAPTQNPDTFDHYSIERSINGTDFTSIATTTSIAYIDVDGLNNSTTYFYQIKAVDNANQESAPSSIVHRMPVGSYLTPPSILSTPAITDVKSSTATISWLTDRESSSVVRYGKSTTNFEASSGQLDTVTNHTVTLTGLASSTLYYLQVQSLDEFRDYTDASAYSTTYSFTTLAAPAVSATTIANITLASADISFITTTVSTTTLYYGLTNTYGTEVADVSGVDATNHTIKLTGLTPGTTYHFRTRGTDIDNNPIVSDDYQFDTLPLPKVLDLKVKSPEPDAVLKKPKVAFIASWITNVPTTTIIRYRASGTEWKEITTAKLEIDHSVEVSNLSDDTIYEISASGRDSLGNLATESTTKFTTPYDTRPPQISDLAIETSMIGSGTDELAQIIVGWKSDEPTTAKVDYTIGSDGSYTDSTALQSDMAVERSVIISNLKPSTLYHLQVVITDKAGNITESGSQVFITSSGHKSAWDLIKATLSSIFGFWAKSLQ